MHGPQKRRWNDLCGEVEVEEDPRKFQRLAEQIKRILNDQQKHLDKREIIRDSE
jgi:hypothetical protein